MLSFLFEVVLVPGSYAITPPFRHPNPEPAQNNIFTQINRCAIKVEVAVFVDYGFIKNDAAT